MFCEHDRGFDLMDRCRSCGYQRSDEELRESEYAELRSRRESRQRDSAANDSAEVESGALF
jgi:hypothetical protein